MHVYLTLVATLCKEALHDSMDLHAVLKTRHSDGLATEAGINEFAMQESRSQMQVNDIKQSQGQKRSWVMGTSHTNSCVSTQLFVWDVCQSSEKNV